MSENKQQETPEEESTDQVDPSQAEGPTPAHDKGLEDMNAGNPYKQIVDSQTEQIEALIKANKALSDQVAGLVRSGIQISDSGSSDPEPEPWSDVPEPTSYYEGDDLSLEALGKMIGGKHG